jgi:Family of unknown function (DUF6049)
MNRRTIALTVAGGAVIALATALPAAATTIPGPAGPAEPTVDITIDAIEPAIPEPGDVLVIEGTVTNTTDAPLESVQALFRHNLNPLGSRQDVGLLDESPRLVWGSRPGHVFDEVTDRLGPGREVGYRLEVLVETSCLQTDPGGLPCVQIQHPGVYVIGVDVREGDPDQPGARVDAGTTLTLLPWQIEPAGDSVPVAMLWPVAATPTGPDDPHNRTTGLLGPGGPLRAVLDAPGHHPVTWAVDPDLLDTVEAIAAGDGRRAAAASTWRATLSEATRGGDVRVLPYASPDFESFEPEVAGRLAEQAIRLSRVAATRLPGAQAGLAWPAGGTASAATVEALSIAGYSTVVLSGAALPQPAPGPLVRVSAGDHELAGLVTDAGLDTAVRSAGDDTVALRQRWLAETALAAMDPVTGGRPLLAAPPHAWLPDPDLAAALIDVWTGTPWAHPVDLASFGDIPPASVVPADSTAPGVLPASNAAAVAELITRLDQYEMLIEETSDADALDPAALRAASAFWARDAETGRAHADELADAITDRLTQVSLQVAPTVTLSSNTGVFPVNVVNHLDVPVTVRLEVGSANPDRMSIEPVTAQRIDAGETEILRVTAEAVANGKVRVDLQLATVDGTPLGSTRHTIVNATEYGVIGWFVIGGAAMLFVAGLAMRTVRGRRRNGSDSTGPSIDRVADDIVEPSPESVTNALDEVGR